MEPFELYDARLADDLQFARPESFARRRRAVEGPAPPAIRRC